MPDLRRIGSEGEDRAATFLLEKGYTIVTRRYRGRSCEVDLIALDGEILVFVEVKLRRAPGYIPEEAISGAKTERVIRAAREFLRKTGDASREARFDVIAIDAYGIRHYVDAFQP